LTKHAASLAAANSRPKATLDDLTRGLQGISISQNLGPPASEPKGLSDILEAQDEVAKDVVVITRVKDDSLNKFHPLPAVPRQSEENGSEREHFPNNSASSPSTACSSHLETFEKSKSTSQEQTLVSMFKNIRISSAKDPNSLPRTKPIKVILKPATVARFSSQTQNEKENERPQTHISKSAK